MLKNAILILSLALVMAVTGLSSAKAEDANAPRTLFELLFGRHDTPPPQQTKPHVKRKKISSITQLTLEPETVAKKPDARIVLVAGDFLAAGLAEGLTTAFEKSPDLVIEGKSQVSSGLVRDDFYNWPDKLAGFIDTLHPAAVVITLGANDRQAMKIGTGKEKFRTDLWMQEYAGRIEAFAKVARDRKVPLIWVGMPSFESDQMSADAVLMNGLYRDAALKVGGSFVDIWEGFVDDLGQFTVTGSDVDGQQARLRTDDGVGLTRAGKRKAAYYVEKELRKLLGNELAQPVAPLDASLPASTKPEAEAVLRVAPVALTDPELDGGQQLLGGKDGPSAKASKANAILFGLAKPPLVPAGRIDSLPLPSPAN